MAETRVIREGIWRCPYCEGKNRGRDLKCAGCGAVRADDVAFEVDDGSAEVTDEKLLARARSGPDWACPYCDTTNRFDAPSCSQCGQNRSEGVARKVAEVGKPAAPVVAAPPRRSRAGRVALVIAAILLGLGFFLFRSTEETLVVAAKSWERTIQVEVEKTVREEAWEGEVPSGARKVSSHRAVHHHEKVRVGTKRVSRDVDEQVQTGTERVKTGTRDLGNGFFEDVYEDRPVYETKTRTEWVDEPVTEDRPVYKTKIAYDIEKWVQARTERAAGEGDSSPAWPGISLGAKEREGPRNEKYRVTFRDEEAKSYEREVSADELLNWRVGQTAIGKTSAARGLVEVKAE